MKTSKSGLLFIKAKEGWENKPYLDSAGLSTIGVGHLIMTPVDAHLTEVTGKDPRNVFRLTDEQVNILLKADVSVFEKALNELIKVDLTQNQFDALVAFVFNIGVGAFKKSTILKRINDKKFDEAADEFLKWTNAGGKFVAGLAVVRFAEKAIFEDNQIVDSTLADAVSFVRKKGGTLSQSSIDHLESLILGYKISI